MLETINILYLKTFVFSDYINATNATYIPRYVTIKKSQIARSSPKITLTLNQAQILAHLISRLMCNKGSALNIWEAACHEVGFFAELMFYPSISISGLKFYTESRNIEQWFSWQFFAVASA